MKGKVAVFFTFILILTGTVSSGKNDIKLADSLFQKRGELFFKFQVSTRDDISVLTKIISIDRVNGKEVFAYANRKEFSKFLVKFPGVSVQILPSPGTLLSAEELASKPGDQILNGQTVWNFYPTYEQYISYMNGFASDHPSLCKVENVGTSVNGRQILAVKISDNVNEDEAEPQFLYTSSIHGDETTGYVLMLHLIDYLLSNYGTNPEVTNLVNSTQIYINPLANPDGTYFGGNNSVSGAIRYNAHFIDLNRNFPDPKVGPHPDGNDWQTETVAWMDYAASHRFTASANFHGGSEVFNYPWDTWSKLSADDNWWQYVGRGWADTTHKYSPAGYFTFQNNGVTNGWAWYEVNGGRQDYMNYWHNCREVTVEISDIKTLPTSQLVNFWNYNYRSILNYIKQAGFGVNGIVTDTVTDEPLEAKVFIQGHDFDNSEVYSHLPSGFYSRLLYEGTYDITFSAAGYFTKTIRNVNIANWSTTHLDVQLRPLTYDAQDKADLKLLVWPNPSDGHFRLQLPRAFPVHPLCALQVVNSMGQLVYSSDLDCSGDKTQIDIDLTKLGNGMYFLQFNSGFRTYIDKMIIRR